MSLPRAAFSAARMGTPIPAASMMAAYWVMRLYSSSCPKLLIWIIAARPPLGKPAYAPEAEVFEACRQPAFTRPCQRMGWRKVQEVAMIGPTVKRAGLAVVAACTLLAMPAQAQDVERGAGLYFHHCAACHGREATGHGPMAGVLIIQPSDLTTLTEEGGVFPTERVVRRIDGRDPLISHGSPMPVYGPISKDRTLR